MNVCMVGVIVQELLQGVKHDYMYQNIKNHFGYLPQLPPPTFDIYESSAQLYRSLRKKGITIR